MGWCQKGSLIFRSNHLEIRTSGRIVKDVRQESKDISRHCSIERSVPQAYNRQLLISRQHRPHRSVRTGTSEMTLLVVPEPRPRSLPISRH
jgi:hypothetical protein